MRKILFRGQTRKFGEKVRMGDGQKLPGHWVYGGVLQGKSSHSIIYGGENADDQSEGLDKWCVHTDTIGQFTGLTDKNGKKIFEGDIVRAESILNSDTWAGYVVWWHGCFAIQEVRTKNVPAIDLFRNYEIIGNIHDNPDLLKGSSSYGERKDNDST